MISTYELELFAKQAATDYLKNGTSLNESIIKLASDNALNKEQIARVVEAANTDVYMNLFNKNDEKYVQFDTADPTTIEATLSQTKSAEVPTIDDSDYYEAPPYEVPTGVEIFEKVAETKQERSSEEILRDYYRFKAAESQLSNLLVDGQLLFDKEATVLKQMIKQAVLGGTSYSEIHAALSSTTEPVFIETLKVIEEELTPNMPIGSMAKIATVLPGSINSKHPMIQQAHKLIKIANEYKTVQTKLNELNSDWEVYKEGGAIKETVERIAKTPGVFLTGLGVGTLGASLAIPAVAKARTAQENSPIKQIPSRYR